MYMGAMQLWCSQPVSQVSADVMIMIQVINIKKLSHPILIM